MQKKLGVAVALCAFAGCLSVASVSARDSGWQGARAAQEAAQEEQRAAQRPEDPQSWFRLAQFYAGWAGRPNFPPDIARRYTLRGLQASEMALKSNPVYYEALKIKAILLRLRATQEQDAAVQRKLIAEAAAANAEADRLPNGRKLTPR